MILKISYCKIFSYDLSEYTMFRVTFDYDTDASLSEAKQTLEKRFKEKWGMFKHVHTD
jgi:hypothetical protein